MGSSVVKIDAVHFLAGYRKRRLNQAQSVFVLVFHYVVCICSVAPCRLRACKNSPAPFPGRILYKATNSGLVSVLYLSMRYTVLLFIRAPFYVSVVFIAMCSVFWLFG